MIKKIVVALALSGAVAFCTPTQRPEIPSVALPCKPGGPCSICPGLICPHDPAPKSEAIDTASILDDLLGRPAPTPDQSIWGTGKKKKV